MKRGQDFHEIRDTLHSSTNTITTCTSKMSTHPSSFTYIQEMQNMPMPNWKLYIPKFEFHRTRYPDAENSVYNIPEHRKGGKYIEDLKWFLHPNRGHHVKRLQLHEIIYSDFDYKIFLKVVSTLQENLQEVDPEVTFKRYAKFKSFKIYNSLSFCQFY